MVDWLKEKYPKVKALAINPPHSQIPNADYNATQNGPENWLPFVSTLLVAEMPHGNPVGHSNSDVELQDRPEK